MKSHREPQVAGAPQGQAEKQTNHHHRQQARPLFAGVLQVHQSKRARKQHGGGPETNRARQCKLRVTAQQEFFKKSHHQEKHSPEQGEAQHPAAVNGKMPKLEAVKAEQKRQQQRDARQPPQRANPEQSAEGPPRPAARILPASSPTSPRLPTAANRPSGSRRTAADRKWRSRTLIPIPAAGRRIQRRVFAHTTAAPPRQTPAWHGPASAPGCSKFRLDDPYSVASSTRRSRFSGRVHLLVLF